MAFTFKLVLVGVVRTLSMIMNSPVIFTMV